jgi:hypothetical protein
MTATYTFDVFTSLDGFGSHSGNWGGYWRKQGPGQACRDDDCSLHGGARAPNAGVAKDRRQGCRHQSRPHKMGAGRHEVRALAAVEAIGPVIPASAFRRARQARRGTRCN